MYCRAFYFVLTFFWFTFWSASGRSDSFLRSFLLDSLFFSVEVLGFFANGFVTVTCSFDSRFDLRKVVMKRKIRNPWMVKAIRSPSMPRVGFVFPIPVKNVRNERTSVENAVMRKMMLLKIRTRNWQKKKIKYYTSNCCVWATYI